jgi:hypothetical protein
MQQIKYDKFEKTQSEFNHPLMTRKITYQYNVLAKFGSIPPNSSLKVVLGSDKDLFFFRVHLKLDYLNHE